MTRRRRRRLSRCSSARRRHRGERGAGPRSACRRLVGLVDLAVDRLVERDPLLGERVLDGVEDVAGQLDVAQDVGDLLGVDAALLAAALEQRRPLAGVDAGHLGRLDGDGASTRAAAARIPRVLVKVPHAALLHPTMQPT